MRAVLKLPTGGATVPVKELVDGLVASDDLAWREFLRATGPIIAAICRKYGLTYDETDDVAQMVVLKLLENNSRVLRQITLISEESFYGWVKVVVSRTALDYIRGSDIRKGREFDSGIARWNEVFGDIEQDEVEFRVMIEQVVKGLSAEERTLFWLDFNDLMDKEISGITGLPLNSVQVKLSRLRKKIKTIVRPE